MISVMATFESALSFRRAVTTLVPWLEELLRYSMPVAVEIACAIGWVTNPCMSSEEPPG